MGGIIMNENLNLYEILKECPKGTKLYCTVLGDVTFHSVDKDLISVRNTSGIINNFSLNGRFYKEGECVLFPSKNQRDWSKFKVPVQKFNPKEFKPFDKVLIRDGDTFKWLPSFLDSVIKEPSGEYLAVELILRCKWRMCIPYNDETKHLLGTKDDCPEYYKWWEE